jgi:hypothetical protein
VKSPRIPRTLWKSRLAVKAYELAECAVASALAPNEPGCLIDALDGRVSMTSITVTWRGRYRTRAMPETDLSRRTTPTAGGDPNSGIDKPVHDQREPILANELSCAGRQR